MDASVLCQMKIQSMKDKNKSDKTLLIYHKRLVFQNLIQSKMKQFLSISILALLLMLNSCGSNDTSNNETNGESTNSNTLKCNECGTSFQKSSGVQLSGHSEVFCSDQCATKWGFAHGISVN